MIRRLARALAALAGLLAGWPDAPAVARPRPDEAERVAWQERIAQARAALDEAQRRSDAAEAAVQKMRHRRKPRGDAREALFAERDAARTDHAEAERALAELLEQARRAGVPPGWLRADEAPPADAPE